MHPEGRERFSFPDHCLVQWATVVVLQLLVETVELHTRRTHLHKLSMLPNLESIPGNSAEASYPDIVSSVLLPRTVLPEYHRGVLYDNRS